MLIMSLGLIFSTGFLIYGFIKIRSVYKVVFLTKNSDKIKEDIERINKEIRETADLKEKNKLLKELKKNYELFNITDQEVGAQSLTEELLGPTKHKINDNLLSQFDFAIWVLTIGFIILLGLIIFALVKIRLSPDYYIYWW
ncbi:MAG: hypothetical protein ACYDIA_14090 [Candidatus Humimicrobiaceae bacterium]